MNSFVQDAHPWIIRYELQGHFGYNFAMVLAPTREAAFVIFLNYLGETATDLQYTPQPNDIQLADFRVLEYILTARSNVLRLVSL